MSIRRLWFAVALLGSVACQPNEHWLHLSGDAQAIGARVSVNGREVGTMKELTYRGSDSSDVVVRARERKLLDDLGIRPGQVYSALSTRVPSGKVTLVLASPSATALELPLTVQTETFVRVNVSKGVIVQVQ
jgi:hypothetical protein